MNDKEQIIFIRRRRNQKRKETTHTHLKFVEYQLCISQRKKNREPEQKINRKTKQKPK